MPNGYLAGYILFSILCKSHMIMNHEGCDLTNLLCIFPFSNIYLVRIHTGYPSHVLNAEDRAIMLNPQTPIPPQMNSSIVSILRGAFLLFQTLLFFHLLP